MQLLESVVGFGGQTIRAGDLVLYPSKSSYSGQCFLTKGRVLECRRQATWRGHFDYVSILRIETNRDWVTEETIKKPVMFYNLESLYKL